MNNAVKGGKTKKKSPTFSLLIKQYQHAKKVFNYYKFQIKKSFIIIDFAAFKNA